MKFGARVIKTGIAISLSVYISVLISADHNAIMAAIAAVTTTAPTVKKSYQMFNRRIAANVIGGVVAVIMLYTIGNSPVAIGLAAILLITILNALKWADVLTLAVITLVAIMSTHLDNYIDGATFRILDTIIGVTVSFLVNFLIYPPHYENDFITLSSEITNQVNTLIRACLRTNLPFTTLEKDLGAINKNLAKSKVFYEQIHEEIIPRKNKRIPMARQLVVFRAILQTNEAMVNLLESLHHNNHLYKTFPEEFRTLVRERMELLMDGHEQILMKYSGRINPQLVQFIQADHPYRQSFVRQFNKQMETIITDETDDTKAYHGNIQGISYLMSAIYAYEEALEQLNDVMTLYRQQIHPPLT